jgi:hypothetical protein
MMNKSNETLSSSSFSCLGFQKQYPHCCECNRGKTVTVEENKRKFILDNATAQQVCRIRIDGCVVDSQTKKCDFLVLVCESKEAYFVELKGKDFISAVEQLTMTIQSFQRGWEVFPKQGVYARAVLSQSPPARAIETDGKVKKLKSLVKSLGGNFEYGTKQYGNDKA